MKREYEDDDGRTVADMSDLPDVSFIGRWSGLHGDSGQGADGRRSAFGFGRRAGGAGSSGAGTGAGGYGGGSPFGSSGGYGYGRNYSAPEMDRDERRMYVLGMLKASLGIGMIYVIAFAVFIALLLFLWK